MSINKYDQVSLRDFITEIHKLQRQINKQDIEIKYLMEIVKVREDTKDTEFRAMLKEIRDYVDKLSKVK